MIYGFAKIFGIDLTESGKPIENYKSIEDFFTRELRPGIRPLAADLASPADGFLARSAMVSEGMAVQAKGHKYQIEQLICVDSKVGSRDFHTSTEITWYQTIYLAPHNYHRVHAPCDGEVTGICYRPGELWPVNAPFVERIPRLFVRNERLIFSIKTNSGGTVWLVMVGAFNVGRMVTPLVPGLVTNQLFNSNNQVSAPSPWILINRPISLGTEIGTFMLGSTVILVFDRKAMDSFNGRGKGIIVVNETVKVLMGQSLLQG